MSLVGTRPPTVDEYEQYELGHRKRLAMKPGLTGMWQVSGRSDITDFDEVVALDAKYIEQWNGSNIHRFKKNFRNSKISESPGPLGTGICGFFCVPGGIL